jgi:hypothetical protein
VVKQGEASLNVSSAMELCVGDLDRARDRPLTARVELSHQRTDVEGDQEAPLAWLFIHLTHQLTSTRRGAPRDTLELITHLVRPELLKVSLLGAGVPVATVTTRALCLQIEELSTHPVGGDEVAERE